MERSPAAFRLKRGHRTMQGVSVVREDGSRGKVVATEAPENVVVEFTDGSRLVLAQEKLALQHDGSYHIAAEEQEVVIPVIAEELSVETTRVARGKVRVHKRVETRQESVDVPVIREEV